MVQKIWGVIWGGPISLPKWYFFQKKSAECSVHLYCSPWVTCEKDNATFDINSTLRYGDGSETLGYLMQIFVSE